MCINFGVLLKWTHGAVAPKTMGMRPLGRSGLHVSELCLGFMTFGTKPKGEHTCAVSCCAPAVCDVCRRGGVCRWGLPSASFEDSCAMVDAFVAAGGNFFDTGVIAVIVVGSGSV